MACVHYSPDALQKGCRHIDNETLQDRLSTDTVTDPSDNSIFVQVMIRIPTYSFSKRLRIIQLFDFSVVADIICYFREPFGIVDGEALPSTPFGMYSHLPPTPS